MLNAFEKSIESSMLLRVAVENVFSHGIGEAKTA